jgi:hypothetical protein
MDELGALILGKAPESKSNVPAQKSTTVSKTQAERDQEALTIIQGELANVQNQLSKTTDPQQKRRLQSDVDSLLKEISRKSKTPLAPQQRQQQQAPDDELGALILGKQRIYHTEMIRNVFVIIFYKLKYIFNQKFYHYLRISIDVQTMLTRHI